jgi:hypothetical protein
MRVALFVATMLALLSAVAHGAVWQSEDGRVTLAEPDPQRYTRAENPAAPSVASWAANDGHLNIAIAVLPNPDNLALDGESLGRGFCKDISGTLTSSSSRKVGGAPVFEMAATGEISGAGVRLIQSVFSVHGNVYKIIAASANADPAADGDMKQLLASLQITGGQAGSDAKADFYGKLGATGIFILLACGVVVLLKRRKGSGKRGAGSGDQPRPAA